MNASSRATAAKLAIVPVLLAAIWATLSYLPGDAVLRDPSSWWSTDSALSTLAVVGVGFLLFLRLDRELFLREEERRRMAQSEEKLAMIFRNSPDAFALTTLDEGRILDVNPRYGELFGRTREELIGRTVIELGLWADPADRANFAKTLREHGRVRDFETRFRDRDGADHFIRISAEVVQHGGRAVIVGINRDVTGSVKAEEELRESEARYRLLAEHTDDFVALNHVDGRRLYVSPSYERLTGWTRAELQSTDWRMRVHPDDLAMIEGTRDANLRGEATTIEHRFRCKNGSWILLETRCRPVRGESGAVDRMVTVSRDITARKQAEAILACQTKVLERIATGAPLGGTLSTLVQSMEVFAPGMLCSVLLLDQDGIHIRHGAAPSLPEEYNRAIDGLPIGPHVGSCGAAAFRREAVIVEDIATDPLWADYRELALSHGLRACWSTPVFDEQQRVLGTFAIYYREPGRPTALHQRCITLATGLAAIAIGRERAEAALRASEGRHRRLVDSNIIGVMIANTDGRITEANDLFLQMIGYTREDLSAGRVRSDTITPPEWRIVDEHIMRAISATGVCPLVEKEYFRKDGTRVPILAAVALLEGTPGDCICLITDLRERRQSEVALRASEVRTRSVFEQANDGIYVISGENRYLDANARGLELLGYTRDELLKMSVAEVLAPHEVARLAVELPRMMSGEPHFAEWQHVRKDGSTFPGEVSARRLDEHSYLAIVRDLTARRQAEAVVRTSEQRLRKVIDGLGPNNFVGLLAPDGTLLEANRPALTAAGLRLEDVLGKPVDQTYWFTYSVAVQQQLRAAVARAAAGEPSRYDVQVRVAEGRLIWLDFSIHPLLDASGKVISLVPSANVIDERKRAELALHEAESRLRLSVAASNIGLWDWNLVTDDVYFSREWKGQLGYAEDEIPNRFDEWQSRLHPDDLAPTVAKVRAFIEDPAAHYEAEFRMRHKDGSWRWIFTQAQILRDEAGKPLRMMGCHLDITGRKQVEAALRESEQKFAGAFRSNPAGVSLTTLDAGRFIEVNEAFLKIFGLSRDQVIGRTSVELGVLVSGEDRRRIVEEVERNGSIRDWAVPFRRADGTFGHSLRSVERLVIGGETCLLTLIVDVTARRQAEAAVVQLSGRLLRAQDAERRRIARELHDSTAQIMAALAMNLSVLGRSAPCLDEAGLKLLAECESQVKRGATELRTLSHLLHPPDLDVFGLARAVRDYSEGFARRSSIALELDVTEDMGRLPQETELALFRILQECLGNLHRHSGSTTASILLARDAEGVTLEVRDTGRGMEAGQLEALRVGRGVRGVGFAGMSERMRLLGGRLEVEPASPGIRVRATLPLPDSAT